MPDFAPERAQPDLVTAKSLRLMHFRTPLQRPVQLETPMMVGAEKKAGVTASRLTIPDLRRSMPVITESRRHDVHRPVRTGPRKDPDLAILSVNNDQQFAEGFGIQKITRFRDLGDVGEADPPLAKHLVCFPSQELRARVGLGGQGACLPEREVGGFLDLTEESLQGDCRTGSPEARDLLSQTMPAGQGRAPLLHGGLVEMRGGSIHGSEGPVV